MCGGGSTGSGNRGGWLGGNSYYNTGETQGQNQYGGAGGWQVSPQLSHGSTTAMVPSGQGGPGGYSGGGGPGGYFDQGYTGPRIAGQPGTGIHAGDVWNPHRSHWTPNPQGIVVPPEWSRHPGAYIYKMTHGGTPTPTPTPAAATPPPPTYWGSLEDQWASFSNNAADWAPGTDMQAAKAAFMNANGYQVPGYMQAMPLPQFVSNDPTPQQ